MNGSGFDLVAVVAAVALAAIFVAAAVAKLRTPAATEADFASLGLGQPRFWTVVVPILELTTAGALLLAPGWGGVAAFGLLAVFTAILVVVIRSGRVATCACFGGASTSAVGVRHLVRNAALLGLALLATTFEGWIWQLAESSA